MCIRDSNQVDEFYCDVVREKAPGLYHDFVTIPSHLLELNNPDSPNLQPVPDSLRHKGKDHIDAKEYDEERENDGDLSKPHTQTCYTDDGKGKLHPTEKHTPKQDTKGTGKNWDDSKPGAGNYVSSVYLTGLK